MEKQGKKMQGAPDNWVRLMCRVKRGWEEVGGVKGRDQEGKCLARYVNNRIRIGWMKWKEESGVMCNRKMPMELKGSLKNNHQTYSSECWAVKKKDESKLNSAEMRLWMCKKGRPGWTTSEMKTSGRRPT